MNSPTNKPQIPIDMAGNDRENENIEDTGKQVHFTASGVDKERQIPPPHLLKQLAEQSHEAVEELQNEIAILKAELQRMNSTNSQQSIDKPPPSNIKLDSVYSTTNTMQSFTTNPTNPSIQYVLNIDPLQQMKDFVKPFFGNPAEDAIKWLDSVVHFIDVIRLPVEKEDLCFQYAPAFLKANAYRWWNENKSLIPNWSTFKRMFIEQFGERNEYLLEQQLNQRKQLPNEPVLQYYYDVIDLCNKCDPKMSDKQKVRKLILGLRLSLYHEAIKENYSTPKQFLTRVEQLENIERLVELRIDDSIVKQEFIDEPIPPLMAQSSSNVRNQDSPSPFPLFRSNNYSASHNFRPYFGSRDSTGDLSSPSNKNSSQPRDSSRVMNYECFQCGRSGHFARDCPQRNKPSSSQTSFHQQKNQ